MTKLDFAVEARTPEIPVDVYDADLVLVDRVLSSAELPVDPGRYYAVGHLPNGDQLKCAVDVAGQTTATALLRVPGSGSTSEELDLDLDLDDDDAADYPLDDEIDFGEYFDDEDEAISEGEDFPGRPYAPRPPERMEWTGHTERGRWILSKETTEWSLDDSGRFPSVEVDVFALEAPQGERSYAVLPVYGSHLFRVRVATSPSGDPVLAPVLAHATASTLLAYVDGGRVSDAAALTTSDSLQAHRLLYDKRQEPVAAAAGAFVLLRLGALDRIEAWTDNLCNWFPWLPDGLVARAELLARLGDHGGAAALLRQLPMRGVPCLSIGLAYAVDRLRTYAQLAPDDDELRAISERMTRYALAADLTAPVTSFSGASAMEPEPRGGESS